MERAQITTNHALDQEVAAVRVSGRPIPGWLAPIVEHFELTGVRLVGLKDIQEARPDLSPASAEAARAELLRLGWLLPSGRRGAYEFVPGAAAGVYSAGDPWLLLRALLRDRSIDIHVGAESAAWLLGYAQRSPERHLLVTRPRTRLSASFRRAYRVLETAPAPAGRSIDGLPVPTNAELFAEVAQLGPRLVLDAARRWIKDLLADSTPDEIASELASRGPSVRARAGYFSSACGADAHAAAIAALGGFGRGPFYTGPQRKHAAFSAAWRVYDTGHFAA